MSVDHDQRVVHSSEDPNWRTPQPLFNGLWNAAGGFHRDLAADTTTHLCDAWYGPGSSDAENALTRVWDPAERGFLNMPYSKKRYRETHDPAFLIESWLEKAYDEGQRGCETWALVPFSPQTDWYRKYVMGHCFDFDEGSGWSEYAASDVWRLPYRVNFDPSPEHLTKVAREFAAGERKNDKVGSAGHNIVVVIWRPDPGWVGPWTPTERYWSYR